MGAAVCNGSSYSDILNLERNSSGYYDKLQGLISFSSL